MTHLQMTKRGVGERVIKASVCPKGKKILANLTITKSNG